MHCITIFQARLKRKHGEKKELKTLTTRTEMALQRENNALYYNLPSQVEKKTWRKKRIKKHSRRELK